ncbi:MAG TPA: hypothetical protein VN893_02070 [Bryobacteraceae bacterium]|nr:hypothetical protein [Bryobacteraceae bacterium]
MTVALKDFAAEMFQPLVGRKLALLRPAAQPGAGRARVELELIRVRVSNSGSYGGGRRPFSLLFTLRQEPALDDRLLHQLVEPGFEECELLVSRVYVPELDRRDGTMYYEAAFG